MSNSTGSKLTVVGAGRVGASIAYAALLRGSARHVSLYDVDRDRVDAEVLDLAHGTTFTGPTDIAGGADIRTAEGSDVVVITAGAAQRPGQSRTDLAGVNTEIVEELMPDLLDVAPDAVFVLVTNPCDVLTVIASEISALPASRVFASGTVLDTSRLRRELARRAGVSVSSVHAHVVGDHGDSAFVLWDDVRIGTVPVLEWEMPDHTHMSVDDLDDIAASVRGAADRVIRGKGATDHAIGISSARIVEAVLLDERVVLPVSTVLSDFHGIDGVALSVPSVVGTDGAVPLRDTPFSTAELAKLTASAAALSDVLRTVRPSLVGG
ncbi:L-lactate dehydrogenase [Frigoribacterium sp. MCBA15_019]|uniref:lactate/malate family dehydrogenase n=1 Tax=unclassified Frigoribacterium TaxID=2627005 RepID=UPI0008DD3648|nr:L-lactate dehydrogenase [Frigoribacterium sp. MCBA15_019]OII26115.1 L-lactate dehydrogenase [Frigoribacterium sp. MCBA15_019]